MDDLLLHRAQQGDPQAFEALMTPLENLVWRVCWHYTGNREDASDCAQEAMVKAWRNLKNYRGDCALESWMYRIAANCSLDFLRRRQREHTQSLEPMREAGFDPKDTAPGPEESALRRDEQTRLRAAVAALPEEQRDALVLTQLEGLDYETAAQYLGTATGTVKSRINRAKQKLKEILSEPELSPQGSVLQHERRP